MGSRICKSVDVTGQTATYPDVRTREPVENDSLPGQSGYDPQIKHVPGQTNQNGAASPLKVIRQNPKPSENEDTSTNRTLTDAKPSTSSKAASSARNYSEYDNRLDQQQVDQPVDDSRSHEVAVSAVQETQGQAEKLQGQQSADFTIVRESEAVQEKGDQSGTETCYNPAGSAYVPKDDDTDCGVPPYRNEKRLPTSTFNIYVANKEVRLKGVITKCCESYTKDDASFVDVPACTAARQHLLNYHMLTLTGKPGEGKTLLARHLLLDMARNEDPDLRMDEVILASTPEDWKDHINTNQRQFVLIEDIFGVSNLSRYRLDMWRPFLDTMSRLVHEQRGKHCVVITSRRHILEEARDLLKGAPFLVDHDIINLAEYKLSPDVKKDILLKHVTDLSPREINEITSCDVPHGFPYCCKIFACNTRFRQRGSAFFENPVGYINDEIERLRRTDVIKYAALVICMLNDGQIHKADLDFTQLDDSGQKRLKTILKLTEVPAETSTTSLIEALDNLTCLYLCKGKDTYRFMHPCLLEVVVKSCAKYIPGAIVKLCCPSFLHERVRVRAKQKASRESYVLCLSRPEFKSLACRFYEEVKEKRIKGVLQHEACRDEEFVDYFASFLEEEQLFTEIVSYFDSSVRSILYWCAWTGSEKLFFYILHGIRTQDIAAGYINQQKSMSLISASFFGYTDIVQRLLDSITEVNFHDKLNNRRRDQKYEVFGFSLGKLMYIAPTPLHAAVCGGHIDIVRKLLYYQASINARDQEGGSPLHIAACAGHVDIMRVLLSNRPKADVNTVDVYGRTPLHIASGASYIHEIVPKEFRAENLTCNRIRDPIVRQQNQLVIAKELVENGCSINIQDCQNDTPLHTALIEGNFHLAPTFISSIEDVDIHNTCGKSALHLAARAGQRDICKLLVDRDANVDIVNLTDNTTPLHMAALSGDVGTVECLLTAKAKTDIRDINNETPLDIAKRRGEIVMVQVLKTEHVTSL